jgi:hypothetical protein
MMLYSQSLTLLLNTLLVLAWFCGMCMVVVSSLLPKCMAGPFSIDILGEIIYMASEMTLWV